MFAVLNRFHQHVRAGTHGPIVQRQVVFGHALLGVEGFGLPRNRRKERHGQPVGELRVLSFDFEPQRVLIRRRNTFELKLPQV